MQNTSFDMTWRGRSVMSCTDQSHPSLSGSRLDCLTAKVSGSMLVQKHYCEHAKLSLTTPIHFKPTILVISHFQKDTTSNRCHASSNKCHASSNRCLTSRNMENIGLSPASGAVPRPHGARPCDGAASGRGGMPIGETAGKQGQTWWMIHMIHPPFG